MALIEPRVAQGLAAAAGVESVDTFAASVISSELESRVRQIVAEAMDVQRHTLEPRLTGAHVMAALKQHALPFRVRRPRGAPAASYVGVRHSAGEGLFAARTATVGLADAMEDSLPSAQAGPSLYAHWLLVRGEQPDVPENPSLPAPAAADAATAGTGAGAQSSSDVTDEPSAAVQTLKPRAAAVLTHEQQQYLNVVTMALLQPDTVVWRGVLTSLAADKGLAILVPHLVRVAGATVSRFVSVPSRATAAAELLEALARNADASTLSLYLHHAVPVGVSVALGGGGNNPPGQGPSSAPDPSAAQLAAARTTLEARRASAVAAAAPAADTTAPAASSSSSSSSSSLPSTASPALPAVTDADVAALAAARASVNVRHCGAVLVLRLCVAFADEHRSLLPRAVAVMERQMLTGLGSLEALEAGGGIKGSAGDDVSADVATDLAMLYGALASLSKLGSAVRETVLQPQAARMLALVEAVAPANARPFTGCNALWTDLFLQRCRALLDPAPARDAARPGPVA